MSEGRVVGELDAAEATEIAILELAAPKHELAGHHERRQLFS